MSKFILLEKKFLIELTGLPIPSIFIKSLNLLFFDKSLKFENVKKYLDNNFAFSSLYV